MRPPTIPGRLVAAAGAHPGRTAVVDGDRQIDHAELLGAAVAVAEALVELGVSPGDRVGVHLAKSAEAVAALHGTMLAGAAYVPLDPKAPVDRLVVTAADAGIAALVVDARSCATGHEVVATVGSCRGAVALGPTPAEVAVDARLPDPFASPVDGGPVAAPMPSEHDVAYLLYTSGSTGTPKGVTISHANALAFVDWAVDTFRLGPDDRLSSHAPFHFDLSVFDLYAAVTVGAAVVLVPPKVARFPVSMVRLVEEQRLTVWYSVPSTLTMAVESGALGSADLSSLRLVLFAGEVFPPRYLAALMDHLPDADHWNLYGPTETNVCTAHRVVDPPDADGPAVPIGRAVSGDVCVVVDDELHPVPAGVQGELVVSGPTVARGYWGAPQRTAERFLLDPVPELPPPPLYRTGDLVVELPDGSFRFEGRRDHQVKSRGHRVELAEVEAALQRHPAVVEAVVVARPDPLVSNRLEAHVVVSRHASVRDLKRHVAATLPPYMVPDEVELHAALPRTSNDKVDRRALLDGGA